MKTLLGSLLCFASLTLPLAGQTPAGRPEITGISHLAVYASDPMKTNDYYTRIVGCAKGADFETPLGVRYSVTPAQYVEVLPLPPSAGNDRLDHIAFQTADAEALRAYLGGHGVTVPPQVKVGSQGEVWFSVKDFEGNQVQFVQTSSGKMKSTGTPSQPPPGNLVGHHIIHVGMVIRDRNAADRFYRDILGFRPYWYGGMKSDRTDWVALQVPNGSDWLEYMLAYPPPASAAPAAMSEKAFGMSNHLSIGVPSMATAVATLKNAKRVGPEGSGPQIGRDGKWQFNDFDPDETRLEYMEFTPVEKPCCSSFTASHPTPGGN